MKMSDFLRKDNLPAITDEELEQIVVPQKTLRTVNRRVLCARYLLEGRPYTVIQEEMQCSTAFIANVVKRLRAQGLLRGWEQRGRFWLKDHKEDNQPHDERGDEN